MIIINANDLSNDALNGLIAEFVTRDGTDYGHHEVTEERKYQQVLAGLEKNKLKIVFDPETQTCNIVLAEHVNAQHYKTI